MHVCNERNRCLCCYCFLSDASSQLLRAKIHRFQLVNTTYITGSETDKTQLFFLIFEITSGKKQNRILPIQKKHPVFILLLNLLTTIQKAPCKKLHFTHQRLHDEKQGIGSVY